MVSFYSCRAYWEMRRWKQNRWVSTCYFLRLCVCFCASLSPPYNSNKRMTSIALILSKSASIQIVHLLLSHSSSVSVSVSHYHPKSLSVSFSFSFSLFLVQIVHITRHGIIVFAIVLLCWLLFYLFTDKCADRYFKYITLNYIRNYAKRKLVC